MNLFLKRIFAFSIFMFLTPFLFLKLAEAGQERKVVRKRQVKQHQRIHEGVRSGELTKEEAKNVRTEQREVRKTKRNAREDGTVTREEKKEIKEMQDEASKNVYEEKHDEEKRN